MFAILEWSDHAWIALIVFLFAGAAIAWRRAGLTASEKTRLLKLEAKVDMLLKHFGLEYKDPVTPGGLSAEVQALADDPAKKIAAIALHREQTGLGLKEAKDAVEAYIDSRR
jgi:ribosomal protein L7/L12